MLQPWEISKLLSWFVFWLREDLFPSPLTKPPFLWNYTWAPLFWSYYSVSSTLRMWRFCFLLKVSKTYFLLCWKTVAWLAPQVGLWDFWIKFPFHGVSSNFELFPCCCMLSQNYTKSFSKGSIACGFKVESLSSFSDISLLKIVTRTHGMQNGYCRVFKLKLFWDMTGSIH